MMHECIPEDCLPGEIEVLGDTSMDGEGTWCYEDTCCEDCPDYYLPNEAGNECVDPACPSDSIKHKDGTCEKCPDFYGPDEDTQTECIQEPCDGNEIIQRSNGKCKECDPFYYPNEDRKECIQDICNAKSILKEDGRCEECEAGKRANDNGRECIKDDCDLETQISDDMGYCITCEEFMKPNEDNSACHY